LIDIGCNYVKKKYRFQDILFSREIAGTYVFFVLSLSFHRTKIGSTTIIELS